MISNAPTYPPRLIRDLMSVGVYTCTPETTISEISRGLLEWNVEEVVVMEKGHNVGVVGHEELIQAYATESWEQFTAEEIMKKGVTTAPADIPLSTAALIMRDHQVRVLYMTHHAGGVEYPAAYLSYRHLIRHLAAEGPEDLADLGIKAQRQSPLDLFIQRRNDMRRKTTKS